MAPRVLGVHASPGADDGPGIKPGTPDDQLGGLLAGCAADIVIGGHTHRAADRTIGRIRALNPGITGIPERPGEAGWFSSTSTASRGRLGAPKRDRASVAVERRMGRFDVDAVVRDLGARLHPNAEFLEAILTGKRPQRVVPDA